MEESDVAHAGDQPHPPKRKRITASCTECRRRKQKCDRLKPCNNCRMRNVPRKCTFDGPSRSKLTGILNKEPGDISGSPVGKDWDIETSTDEPQRASDLGYSLATNSNAFMELKQVLPVEDGVQGVVAAGSNLSQRIQLLNMNVRSLVAELPRKPLLDKLIDVFFANINWHYDIVERFYFDDLVSHWTGTSSGPVDYLSPKKYLQELRYVPALLFQVLAHSLQFLPPDSAELRDMSESELKSSRRYSDIGNEIVEKLGRQGLALTAVQADLLRASLLKNVGRGTEAWFSLGDAIRQAQQLGLHRNAEIRHGEGESVAQTLSLIWYDEYKRRVWINLFVWDSLMAMILGRPRSINLDDCDAKLPIDCSTPNDPSKTVPMAAPSVGRSTMPSSVTSSLIRYSLAEKVHEMRALKLDRPYPRDPSLIQTFHEQVIGIVDNAPPMLRSKYPDTSLDTLYPFLPQQREDMLTLVNLFLMTLHRPHIVARGESRKAAFDAAIATLESQQRYFDQTEPHQYKLFSLSFYTIDAAILLSVLMILYPPQSPDLKRQVDQTLQLAIRRLSVIEPYNSMASSGLNILQHCHKKLEKILQLPDSTGSAAELQDLQRELNGEIFRLENLESGQCSFPGEIDFLSPVDEMSLLAGDFQGTYWLDQINQIQSYPWIGSGAESMVDYIPFN